jgi:hypothetical protein
MSPAAENQHGESRAGEAERFINDPAAFFEMSHLAMNSISGERAEQLRLAALKVRFAQHLETIPMVAKLAGRQGITELETVADVVPLLFEHTMYKSYPTALLERGQFDKLTGWLDKLTSVDLSGLDVSSCDSIDSWLGLLADQTDMDVSNTSGTSGTMSFFPWTGNDLDRRWRVERVTYLQEYGEAPAAGDLTEPIHYIQKGSRFRGHDKADAFTRGDDALKHRAVPKPPSADLLWLAARLRLAAAKGDSSRVGVPATLMARRAELEQQQARERDAVETWVKTIESLQGERVLWSTFPFDVYDIAAGRLEAGEQWSFAPGSLVLIMGGSKGNHLPPDWLDITRKFVDARVLQAYGMTEMSCLQLMCPAGRYHIKPWVIPFLLEPETSELLPRKGVQTGRFAFFDLMPEGHWGGVISGDEVQLDFDGICECGAKTQHIGAEIARLSDKRGGDDKITCTATPQAYDEAMRFLSTR